MGSLRSEFGFWHALGQMRLSDLRSPEIIVGIVLGGGGGVLLVLHSHLATRQAVAGDYVQLSAALVGVVFAGFALVIGLLSDDYLRWLEATGSGVIGFLRPFMVSTGMQVGAVLAAVIYRGAAAEVPHRVEHWAFPIASALFVTALLDVVALARLVLMHGVARARGLKISDIEVERQRKRAQAP
jgi:hypothetical protein